MATVREALSATLRLNHLDFQLEIIADADATTVRGYCDLETGTAWTRSSFEFENEAAASGESIHTDGVFYQRGDAEDDDWMALSLPLPPVAVVVPLLWLFGADEDTVLYSDSPMTVQASRSKAIASTPSQWRLAFRESLEEDFDGVLGHTFPLEIEISENPLHVASVTFMAAGGESYQGTLKISPTTRKTIDVPRVAPIDTAENYVTLLTDEDKSSR
ncbi:hypothetical protein LWF01_13895 [Saxibacter everestensis]|uniref:Uncharacterized protein n=1 Tax=Saxibacter everestensis TaxID=2909229 RepID=A0ABY8QS05_9MICO|nr:hypothetical protein LWF01_13895 [Brevibacteriaceae bacterium ZFBP1038]